jgi:hypothetical protein
MKRILIIILCGIVTILTVSLAFWTIDFVETHKPKFNSAVITVISELSEQLTESITEIEDNSSTLNGKWIGLCEKDSIKSIDDFRKQVESDSTLRKHFNDFEWNKAQEGTLPESIKARVSHRSKETILVSTKFITLPKGDKFITDGKTTVRAHCCNNVKKEEPPLSLIDIPEPPVVYPIEAPVPLITLIEQHEPAIVFASPSAPITSYNKHMIYGHRINRVEGAERAEEQRTAPVPEPETFLLFGIGLLTLCCNRFIKRKRS